VNLRDFSQRLIPAGQRSELQTRIAALVVTSSPVPAPPWHTHPLSQTLIVTFDLGRAQPLGSPILFFGKRARRTKKTTSGYAPREIERVIPAIDEAPPELVPSPSNSKLVLFTGEA
jgi:hypothetical protein